MNVREEDPAPAPCAPESQSDRESPYGGLLRTLRRFSEVTTAFLHMRMFLEARGIHNISELNDDDRAVLILYLEAVRARLEADRP